MIEARVICDSMSPDMKRLTTFKLRYPKFIHGEFMTHRVISRNASSSRAIPVQKLLDEIRSGNGAAPVHWGKNEKGMSASGELSADIPAPGTEGIDNPVSELVFVKKLWEIAGVQAVNAAEAMMRGGAHKQIVNRILEPFSHINVVATATEWDNFFGLRLHAAAQPEMRALAKAMWEAWNNSTPKELKYKQWHLPFVEVADENWDWDMEKAFTTTAIRISVARCARVSYESFETGKFSTTQEDLRLCEQLQKSGHWSPFEHQATPEGRECDQWGNFVGWRQYRKMFNNEAVAPLPEEFLPF